MVPALVLSVSSSLVLSACGAGERTDQVPPQAERASVTVPPPAQAVVPGRVLRARTSPLTGLRPPPGSLDRPVLVVKIENSVEARPQSGLEAADLVVEELVEGGITRFAAMFQSRRPGTVGPVRSVRHVDASLAGPTHGLLAYSGGAGNVLGIVRRAPVRQLAPGQAGNAYHRSGRRRAPHNLYASGRALYAHAHRGHQPRGSYLPFAPDAASATTASGPRARVLRLAFSRAEHSTWTWDRARHRWVRSEGSRPARAASGARLAAANIVVLRVRTRDAGYRDPAGNGVPETVLTGSGTAVLATGGRVVHVRWHKAGRDRPLRLTRGGRPVQVAPGRTWVELVPLRGSVRIR